MASTSVAQLPKVLQVDMCIAAAHPSAFAPSCCSAQPQPAHPVAEAKPDPALRPPCRTAQSPCLSVSPAPDPPPPQPHHPPRRRHCRQCLSAPCAAQPRRCARCCSWRRHRQRQGLRGRSSNRLAQPQGPRLTCRGSGCAAGMQQAAGQWTEQQVTMASRHPDQKSLGASNRFCHCAAAAGRYRKEKSRWGGG